MAESTPVNPQIEFFSKLVSVWRAGYRRAVRSWIAVPHPEIPSDWQLLSAELIFETADTTGSLRAFTVKTKSLWAGVEIVDLEPADILHQLEAIKTRPFAFSTRSGEFVLRSPAMNSAVKSAAESAAKTSNDVNCYFYPLGRPPLSDGRRRVSLQISAFQSGNTAIPDRTRLELELFNADLPINGIGDLLSRLGKPDNVMHGFQTPTIDIVAVAPASLQRDSSLREGTGSIRISSPQTLDRDLFSLGLIYIERSGPSWSSAISSNDISWEEIDGRCVGTVMLHNVNTPALVVILRHNGEYLDRLNITHAGRALNDLYEIHRAVDPNDHLQTLLGNSDANAFERGVALLLGNLGLSVFHYGGIPRFSDGPDCYAVSSRSDLYVVECTTGHPDNKGKLQKVHNRAELIRDLSQQRGLIFKNIQSILVTGMSHANTFEVAAQARDLGIALVCREDLASWHDLIATAHVPTAEEFQARVLALVPRRGADMPDDDIDQLN